MRWLSGLLLLGGLCWLCGCDGAPPYQRKNGTWFYDDRPLDTGPGADLQVLNRHFAKTATQAYYRYHRINQADAASFVALDEHHALDRQHVYHGDTYRDSRDYFLTQRIRLTTLVDADPASFQLLGQGYARDARQAYHDGQRWRVRDVASLVVLDNGFTRDRHTGYYLREPVAGSDGASFATRGRRHAHDARHVYFADTDYQQSPPRPRTRRLPGADPQSFVELEGGYGKDARQVFWEGQPVQGADPASFELLSPSQDQADARDAQRQYKQGRPVGA